MGERLRKTVKCVDDLPEDACIGTSSLRRISQLQEKYPKMRFETIRGNLQTRFSKLDNTAWSMGNDNEKPRPKFDAIILAAAGLKRMNYPERITQLLPMDICVHAVSQGALGIECRRDDEPLIRMINELNHEETLLKVVAERTFLAKLEGGCSAPVGIFSQIVSDKMFLQGCVMELDGSRRIQDKFEMRLTGDANDNNCPVLSTIIKQQQQQQQHQTEEDSSKIKIKRNLDDDYDDNENNKSDENNNNKKKLKTTKTEEKEEATKQMEIESSPTKKTETESTTKTLARHYSFIVDMNIAEEKLIKAELCGLHLAERLKELGAD